MTSATLQQESSSEEMLRKAQEHYARLTTALQEAETRLANNETAEIRGVADLVRTHWKAFQSTFELEINLEKRNREREGIVHGYALDLERAQSEVGRRLACLKTAAGDSGVSERAE